MLVTRPILARCALLAALTGISLDGAFGAGANGSQSRAPMVKTGPAQSITSTSAKLTGKLDDYGVTSFYEFEWGPTRKYGHKTTLKSAGSKNATVNASQVLKRLKPGHVYHYRLLVISGSSPTFGADRSFKTT